MKLLQYSTCWSTANLAHTFLLWYYANKIVVKYSVLYLEGNWCKTSLSDPSYAFMFLDATKINGPGKTLPAISDFHLYWKYDSFILIILCKSIILAEDFEMGRSKYLIVPKSQKMHLSINYVQALHCDVYVNLWEHLQ